MSLTSRKTRLGPSGIPRPWTQAVYLNYEVEAREIFVAGAIAREVFVSHVKVSDWWVSGNATAEVFIAESATSEIFQPGTVVGLGE